MLMRGTGGLTAKQQLNLLELRRRTDSGEPSSGGKKLLQKSGAIQLKGVVPSPNRSGAGAGSSSLEKSETVEQMAEVLKKLNLGDASDHLVRYMGQQFRPQGRRHKEDEQVAKLRHCKQSTHSLPSSGLPGGPASHRGQGLQSGTHQLAQVCREGAARPQSQQRLQAWLTADAKEEWPQVLPAHAEPAHRLQRQHSSRRAQRLLAHSPAGPPPEQKRA